MTEVKKSLTKPVKPKFRTPDQWDHPVVVTITSELAGRRATAADLELAGRFAAQAFKNYLEATKPAYKLPHTEMEVTYSYRVRGSHAVVI